MFMKTKLQLLTKTLLVTAGLCVGASAWADTYEILYGNAVEESGVITGVTAQTAFTDTYATTLDADDANNNASLNLSGSVLATTTAANWTKNFSSDITTGKVYFSGIYRIAANTNQRIRIVDSKGNVIFGTAQNNTGSNADQIVAYICGTEISNYVRLPRTAGYGVDEICIDLDAKTVNYSLTVSSGNGTTTKKTGAVDFPYDNVRGLYFCKASGDDYRTFLDNVKFYSVVSSDPEYTINYKLGENIVRTVNGRAALNETVSASTAINGAGDYAGNHYLITAATAPSMTIVDGTNVLDVPVRVPYTATLSVTTTVNGVAGEPVVTTLTETDEKVCAWSFSFPKYQKSGDVYYPCDETTYVQIGTFTDGETINKTVTYNTADESIMAFSEVGSNGTNAAYSGGAYGDTNSQLASCTLNKGVYKAVIVVVSKSGSGSNHRTESLVVGGNVVNSTENGVNKTYEFFFTVAEDNTEAYVKGNGSSNYTDNLDYVLISKLYDITDASKIIGAVDKSTASADDVFGDDILLKNGDVKKITFKNHGADYGKNWMLKYSYGGSEVTTIRADWYWKYEGEENASKRLGSYTDAYSSANGLNWNTWTTDMDNSTVVLTVSNIDGKFAVDGTMTGASDTYYFKYAYDNSFDGDITLNLSVNLSWLEVLSVEQTAVGVTTTSAGKGWATLYTDKGLDFSGVEDLTAYTATLNGTTVTLNDVNDIQAETGIVLKSTTTDATTIYSVPVTTTSTTDKGSLTGSTTEVLTYNGEDSNSYYMLTLNSNDEAQFSKLTSGSIAAGKAYLVSTSSARSLKVVFADESTGISGIQSVTRSDGQTYNLNGQRVAAPQKGLYIINGKKVIVK